MPAFGNEVYGDLYVEYKVVLPLELSPTLRRSKSLLLLVMGRFLNPWVSELDRAFNGDYSEGNGGRDEL